MAVVIQARLHTLLTRDVHPDARDRATLDDEAATQLGVAPAPVLGGPQDIEWTLAHGHT